MWHSMCWRVQSEARDSDLPRNDPRRNLGVPVFEREARVKYLVTLECAVTRVSDTVIFEGCD